MRTGNFGLNAYTIESAGKSSESTAQTWSIGRFVIMYVAAIVLTSPTLGIASITVPPARFTSLNVRKAISVTRSAPEGLRPGSYKKGSREREGAGSAPLICLRDPVQDPVQPRAVLHEPQVLQDCIATKERTRPQEEEHDEERHVERPRIEDWVRGGSVLDGPHRNREQRHLQEPRNRTEPREGPEDEGEPDRELPANDEVFDRPVPGET